MCSSIKKLNLRDNTITSEDNISFLCNLVDLKYLNLSGNPICQNKNYKLLVEENLPKLETLDKDDEEEKLNINEKKFYESNSTFSSSPSGSKNVSRPTSSNTSNNFFNSKLKFKEKVTKVCGSYMEFTEKSSDYQSPLDINKTGATESENSITFENVQPIQEVVTKQITQGLKPVIKKKAAPFDLRFNKQVEEDKDSILSKGIINKMGRNKQYSFNTKNECDGIRTGFAKVIKKKSSIDEVISFFYLKSGTLHLISLNTDLNKYNNDI